MCIIKKVFYYKETKLPVIKYKDEDEIWVRAKTVANIWRYKNTMKLIHDHVKPEDRKETVRIGAQIQTEQNVPPGKVTHGKEREKHNLYQRVRIIQSNT